MSNRPPKYPQSNSVFNGHRWISPEEQSKIYNEYYENEERRRLIKEYNHEYNLQIKKNGQYVDNDNLGRIYGIALFYLIPLTLILISISGYMDYSHRKWDGERFRNRPALFEIDFIIGFITPIISIMALWTWFA